VIYPINALCNGQRDALDKYLYQGYPDVPKVRPADYTAQARGEDQGLIIKNPPDVLLANYIMRDYILTSW